MSQLFVPSVPVSVTAYTPAVPSVTVTVCRCRPARCWQEPRPVMGQLLPAATSPQFGLA